MRSGIFIAFLFALLKGVYGKSTPLCKKGSQCFQILPQELVEESWMTTTPDAEVLKKFCPSLKAYMNCQLIFTILCSDRESDYAEVSRINNVTIEICDEESRLHKAFVRSIGCIFPLIRDRQFRSCSDDARDEAKRYVLYRSHQEEDDNVDDHEVYMESQCLTQHLNVQCGRSLTDEKCGREAGDTFYELYTRLETVCSEEEMSDTIAKYNEMLSDNPTVEHLSELLLNPVSENEGNN